MKQDRRSGERETVAAPLARGPSRAVLQNLAQDDLPHGSVAASLADDSDVIFADLAAAKAVLIAVSGGPDSLALMLLAADWAQRRTHLQLTVPRLFVATVDHALRPDSAAEAAQVADWAKALGLPHRTLIWQGVRPKTRLQERARAARYALLDAYAAEIGADMLLTAHHADDQAETILFRLLRGSGIAGLAGMSRSQRRGDLVHLRPLLDYPKARLIAYCEARGQAFFRDPSNENPAFARTRLRRLAPRLAQDGLDRDALLRLGHRAAKADAALTAIVEQHRRALLARREAGHFSADIAALAQEPAEIFSRFLAAEIATLAAAKPLRLERLETLAAALQLALQNGQIWRGTLAGLALCLDRHGVLTLIPEKPRRRGMKGGQKTARTTAEKPPLATENSPSLQRAGDSCGVPVTYR